MLYAYLQNEALELVKQAYVVLIKCEFDTNLFVLERACYKIIWFKCQL